MSTKEKVKIEIENLPDDLIEQVYEFINSLKAKKNLGDSFQRSTN